MRNEQKSFVYENLKFLLRKLITSNVGSSPDTSLGAYGPRVYLAKSFRSR